MPPRKRTNQVKPSPQTSPTTSTSRTSPDQRHLRTRSSTSTTSAPPKLPPSPAHPKSTREIPATQKDAREKKSVTEVSPARPPRTSSFSRFMYVLASVTLLLLAWYAYEMVTLLARLKDDVGWWGIVVGDSGGLARWETKLRGWGFASDRFRAGGGRGAGEEDKDAIGALEGSLNALADALGISPRQVASAVKPLIPEARLRSVASRAGEIGGSEVVRILFEDTTRYGTGRDDSGTTGIAEELEDAKHAADGDV